MKAKDLFPDETERNQVKQILNMFKGRITRVEDKDGNILFENEDSHENKFDNR